MYRRQYLESSAGVISVASVGLAGCLGGSEDAGDTEPDENGPDENTSDENEAGFNAAFDAFDGDYESVAKWLPAPSVLDTDPYIVASIEPAEMLGMDDYLEADALAPVTALLEELGIGMLELRDVDRLVVARFVDPHAAGTANAVVLERGIDSAPIGSTLEDAGGEHAGREDGYDYYDTDSATYGVVDGVLIAGLGSIETRSIVEAVVAAEMGTARRYVDESNGFERVVERLPAGHMASVGAADPDSVPRDEDGIFETAVADGDVVQIRGEDTLSGHVIVLEDGTDVDVGDVETLIEESDGLQELEDLAYGVDDATVWIRGTEPTADFRAGL